MKNRLIVLFLLILSVLVPLYAGPAEDNAGESSVNQKVEIPFVPIYKAIQEKSFTIRAYKNTSKEVNMVIYDALTTNLDEVRLDQNLDIYPHIGKFLDRNWQGDISQDKTKVLFSYLVTGNVTGSYTLTMSFEPFKSQDGKSTVNAQFDVINQINRFQDGSNVSGTSFISYPPNHNGKEDKMTNVKNVDGVIVSQLIAKPQQSNCNLITKWNVTDSANPTTQHLWTAEGVIVMALSDTDYNAASIGDYKSVVKIKLETGI